MREHILLVLLLNLLFLVPSGTGIQYQPNDINPLKATPWVCGDGSQVIQGSRFKAGVLETPNFPQIFNLPVNCVWVLDYSSLNVDHYVHVYFTQFYLAPKHLYISVMNRSDFLDWQSIGFEPRNETREYELDFQRHRVNPLHGNFDYIVFRLNITNDRGYNYVHKHVLDVYDSYGFQIAYEITTESNRRKDDCDLTTCNMNGICQVEHTIERITSFRCSCTVPNRPYIVGYKFGGEHCAENSFIQDCTRQTCSNRGKCHFFSSRTYSCQCDPGFSGRFCEIENSQNHSRVREDPSQDESVSVFVADNLTEVAAKMHSNIVSKLAELNMFIRYDASNRGRVFFFSKELRVLTDLKDNYLFDFINQKLASDQRTHRKLYAKVVTKPSGILKQDDELRLSCFAIGGVSMSSLRFEWMKNDHFNVNTSIARRAMETNLMTIGDEVVEVLTLSKVGQEDNGVFRCQVSDEELLALVPYAVWRDSRTPTGDRAAQDRWDGKGPFSTRSSAQLNVMVASVPDLEVYPRSLTILETSEPWDKKPFHTLNCLAHSRLDMAIVGQYRFKWLYHGVDVADMADSRNIFVEEVWHPLAKSTVVVGLLLKIREIQSNVNFTCLVTIDGYEKVNASTSVHVFLAKSENEVCKLSEENGVQWPMAKKSTTVSRPCQIDDSTGFTRRKCEPTTKNTPGSWSNHPDQSECLRKWVHDVEHQVGYFFNGFVNAKSSHMIQNFFHDVPTKPDSAPMRNEFDHITNLALDIVKYLWGSNFEAGGKAEHYFEIFVPWLFRSVEAHFQDYSQHSGKLDQFSRLFNLVNNGSLLFASKLDLGEEKILSKSKALCQPDLWVQIGHFNPKDMPTTNRGNASLMGSRDQRSSTTVLYMSQGPMQNRERRNVSIKKERDLDNCSDVTSVEVTSSPFGKNEKNLLVSIVKFQKIDANLGGYRLPIPTSTRNPNKSNRNSSAVSIWVESETPRLQFGNKKAFHVLVSIRFHQYIFKKNDTIWTSLSCGKMTEFALGTFHWEPRASECKLLWHKDGLTCQCTQPGTYALFWSEPELQSANRMRSKDLQLISLCCTGCLTTCIITFSALSYQMWKQNFGKKASNQKGQDVQSISGTLVDHFLQNPVLLNQILISGILAVVVASIILVVEDPRYIFWWTSLGFQYLFLAIFSLQIALMSVLNSKLSEVRASNAAKLGGIAAALVLPVFYCLIFFGVEGQASRSQPLSGEDAVSISRKHWFVLLGQTDFKAFIATMCLALALFMLLAIRARSAAKFRILSLKQTQKKKLLSLVRRSCWMTMALYTFAICSIIFVNSPDGSVFRYVFAASTIKLGVVVFICYLTTYEGEFGAGSPLGSLKLKLPSAHSKTRTGKSSPSLPSSGPRCCHSTETCPGNETETQFLLMNSSFEQSLLSPQRRNSKEQFCLHPGHVARLASFDQSCLDSRGSSTLNHDSNADRRSGQMTGVKLPSSLDNSGSHSIDFVRSVSRHNTSRGSSVSFPLNDQRFRYPPQGSTDRPMCSKLAHTKCLLSLDTPPEASSTPTKGITGADVRGGVPGAPQTLREVIYEAKQAIQPPISKAPDDQQSACPEFPEPEEMTDTSRAPHLPIHGGSFSSGDSGMVQPRSRKSTNTSGIRTSSEGSIDEGVSLDGSSLHRHWSLNSNPIPEYQRRPSPDLDHNVYVEQAPSYGTYMTMSRLSGKAPTEMVSYNNGHSYYVDTNDLLQRARDKIRPRTCSTGDSGPSSEPDSADGGLGSSNFIFEVPNTPPNSMVALQSQGASSK